MLFIPDLSVKFSAYSKEELEAYQHIEELAHLITEKVKFLGEGKEPVSPVQIMAIQIEVRSNLDMSYKRTVRIIDYKGCGNCVLMYSMSLLFKWRYVH